MNTATENSFSGEIPTSFRSPAKMPFRDSETATHQPKKLPTQPPPSLLSKLRSAFKSADETEMEDAQAALLRRQAAVREIADRLNGFTADVETAKARVVRAGEEFEELKQLRRARAEGVVQNWGKDPQKANIYNPVPPMQFYYTNFAAIDAALTSYPAAQKYLAAEVVKAEKALLAFRKENDLIEH